MNTVTVRYFAALRERIGLETEQITISGPGAGMTDLLEILAACHGDEAIEALTGPGVRIALNDELLEGSPEQLRDGDVVAFLPPVTGG